MPPQLLLTSSHPGVKPQGTQTGKHRPHRPQGPSDRGTKAAKTSIGRTGGEQQMSRERQGKETKIFESSICVPNSCGASSLQTHRCTQRQPSRISTAARARTVQEEKKQHRNRENLSKITLESEAFFNLKQYLRKQPNPDQYDLKLQFQLPFKVNSRKPQMKQSISISFLGHTCKTLKQKADFHQLYAAKPPISRQNTRAELPPAGRMPVGLCESLTRAQPSPRETTGAESLGTVSATFLFFT